VKIDEAVDMFDSSMMSQRVFDRDWQRPEEDEAWKDL
jgi:hypothetical protein